MGIFNAFFIFLLIWWVMLFTVLPLGVERNDDGANGNDIGAPKFANLKKKLILNTIISAVILAVIWILVALDVIRWSAWFERSWS